MLSFRRLRSNAGLWSIVLLVFVVLAMVALAVHTLVDSSSPWPLLSCGAAVAFVLTIRRWVLGNPETSSKVLLALRYGLVVFAASSALWRHWIAPGSVPVITGLCLLASVYGAWFFILYGDDRVERR